jgi:EAL domain-containing protein (putative c-di-GMP-specific phosphodiesterase class I)
LYQIIVTPDRKPVGVEVLAHLEGQDQTVITTNQFIEASAANGMINQIGLQIMDLGFAAASAAGLTWSFPSMFLQCSFTTQNFQVGQKKFC